MINNRQAGRRNRGRNNNNNGRPNGNNRGGGDNGNRIDNRARGNATQLLEKYKNMARDAQMAGDRVNAEYYLQFADHYFRVLADNRARQEEQNPRQRTRDDGFDQDGDDFDGGYDGVDDFRTDQQHAHDRAPREQNQRDQNGRDHGNRDQVQREQGQRDPQQDRRPDRQDDNREAREPRENREPRAGNVRRDRPRRDRFNADAPVQQEMGVEGPAGNPATEAPRQQPVVQTAPESTAPEAEAPRPRRGRPRKVVADADANEGLDLAVLPPSIARADNDADVAEEAPKKRNRRARPATEAAE
ncbi:DUF4167 domain-containing protein [Sphingobium cupriresistens]|uniref:DUF4167 domain-containing protein n=1 Tax=Sphingobium cupriresistens TaxID=1132417 RepID=A0A8G2E191_9SPHN|nr:DUF4167 domain-containing protein [Sphingobium cupriresistens]RYM14424.1 DUF4167 domain-containing protein [Sphingobium cupriresistens]